LPTTTSVTLVSPCSRRNASEARRMFELNAPHSPLSAVMMTRRLRAAGRRTSSGCASPSARRTRLESSSAIFTAYGRAETRRSWARRSLAAATSFMARVIFWVDSTERIRRRMSRSVAMAIRP
jgi:hypothetical protein